MRKGHGQTIIQNTTQKTKDRVILIIRDDRMCSGAPKLKPDF